MDSEGSLTQHRRTEQAVADLYNRLGSYEQAQREVAYPIHKRLYFNDNNIRDIYHWLVHNLTFPKQGTLLDAGCGVGFGSQYIAQTTSLDVTGISLSQQEIDFAQNQSQQQGAAKVHFQRMSFDAIPANNYDCVVFVESIKHSPDLGVTLTAVKHALKQGGCAYIVEDIASQDTGELLQGLNRAWQLERAYRMQDYQAAATAAGCRLEVLADLTQNMRIPPVWWSMLKAKLFSLVAASSNKGQLAGIYHGGFLLDQLYAQSVMHYQVLKLTPQQSTQDKAAG